MKKTNISDALKNLRKVRAGETRASQAYEVKDESVLVTVDDAEYEKIKTNRLSSRFIDVVDDGGDGNESDYVDDGEEFWEHDTEDDLEDVQLFSHEQTKIEKKRKQYSQSKVLMNDVPVSQRLDHLFNKIHTHNGTKHMASMEIEALETLDAELADTFENNSVPTISLNHPIDSIELPSASIKGSFRDLFSTTKLHLTRHHKDIYHIEDLPSSQELTPYPKMSSLSGSIRKREIEPLVSHDVVSLNGQVQKKPKIQPDILSSFGTIETDQVIHTQLHNLENKKDQSVCESINSTKITHACELELQDTLSKDHDVLVQDAFTNMVQYNKSLLHTHSIPCDHNSFPFYFIDLYDDNKQLYLFGKVWDTATQCKSCCIIIKYVHRNVFILPREQPPMLPDDLTEDIICSRIASEVYEELRDIRRQLGIKRGMYKPVKRQVVLDIDGVPKSTDLLFIKCVYTSDYGPLPHSIKGKTFSHIFGSDTSLSELFLIKRKIMGPSWLLISDPINKEPTQRLSHCHVECSLENEKYVTIIPPNTGNVLPTVHMSIVSLTIQAILCNETVLGKSHNEPFIFSLAQWDIQDIDSIDEIVSSSPNNYSIGIRRGQSMTIWPMEWKYILEKNKYMYYDNEDKFLIGLLTEINKFDPDIIVGHSLINSDLEMICHRLKILNINQWHQLSRLSRPIHLLKQRVFNGQRRLPNDIIPRFLTLGRLLCDTELQCRDLLRQRAVFDLLSVSESLFGTISSCSPLVVPNQGQTIFKTIQTVTDTAINCLSTCSLVLKLMIRLRMLPLTRELALLSGHIWNRTLLNKRAERNEYLLLHRFHQNKLIKPDKIQQSNKREGIFHQDINDSSSFGQHDGTGEEITKRKAGYLGGLVLEPKSGLYDRFVLLLDFNSLYPSIIQEYNICFSTITLDNEGVGTVDSKMPGILPGILHNLVDRRRKVKAAMKSASDSVKDSLHIRQMALKLIANSIYGCLGFPSSRFYARPIAALITRKGREALEDARRTVETELRLNVIYGDTDSIMVDTGLTDDGQGHNYNQSLELADKIKKLINRPGSQLEIELDGVFSRLLLLKKKKYACIKILDYKQHIIEHESKGLDIVRRDWCGLTKLIGDKIIRIIFNTTASVDTVVSDIHDLLVSSTNELNTNKIPLDLFIITKALNKMPQHYADAKSQPHVQVALRLSKLGRCIHPGLEVQYIICSVPDCSNSTHSIAQRAFSPEEVIHQELKIDIEWYKATQLLPPISRLCQHVVGTSVQRLAECLGLKNVGYVEKEENIIQENHLTQDDLMYLTKNNSLLNHYPLFDQNTLITKEMIRCPFCLKEQSAIDSLTNLYCNHCQYTFPIPFISNWMELFVHRLFWLFGRYEQTCIECFSSQGKTTRVSLISGRRCPQASCPLPDDALQPTLPATQIHNTLEHLRYLIEIGMKKEHGIEKQFIPYDTNNKYHILQTVRQITKYDAFHNVNIQPLLSVLRPHHLKQNI